MKKEDLPMADDGFRIQASRLGFSIIAALVAVVLTIGIVSSVVEGLWILLIALIVVAILAALGLVYIFRVSAPGWPRKK